MELLDKSCYVCPNMTRIFPPAGSRRRITVQSNYSDSGSNISLQKRNGYVKINYKLVRQCLIYASANEKSEVLDAIRLVSFVVSIIESMYRHFF